MSRRRRTGKRRSPSTQHARNNAAFQRKLAAKQRLASALKRKAALIKAIRERDLQRESSFNRTPTHSEAGSRGTKDASKRVQGPWTPKPAGNAARSARSKTATHTQQPSQRKWKTPAELAAFNARRREKRNKWGSDPCAEKPNSRKAGKMRQDPTHKGQGGAASRRWC